MRYARVSLLKFPGQLSVKRPFFKRTLSDHTVDRGDIDMMNLSKDFERLCETSENRIQMAIPVWKGGQWTFVPTPPGLRRPKWQCPVCRGSGRRGFFGRKKCNYCSGTGRVCPECSGRGRIMLFFKCSSCAGTGKLN